MKRVTSFLLLLSVFILNDTLAFAEYRAYELEVFDKVSNRREIVRTSFSPNDYVFSNGGPQRVGVIIRASWICYGDTSNYKTLCPTPEPINPRYKVGERVQVILNHHVSHQWFGVVDNIYFRPDLKSNVYGVRFPDRQNLYTQYYEATLQKAP